MKKPLFHLLLAAFVLVTMPGQLFATVSTDELSKLLPERLNTFRRLSAPRIQEQKSDTNEFIATAEYASPGGATYIVTLNRVQQDAKAYELLTTAQTSAAKARPALGGAIGTAGYVTPELAAFFRGPVFVTVSPRGRRVNEQDLLALAKEIAEKLDRGEGEIPVLIKHLPNWEQAQTAVTYLNRFNSLESIATEPVLSVVSSEGDADAVMANYESMRLLVIEFNTPQRAAENDQRIIARIRELWNLGQPAPSAYRRIGNYVAFVFDAPTEQAAKQLIDQVHYEQVVSWLGQNPNILKEAEREYVRTTLGVLVAVLKASGFALVGCFAAGALFGTLLFNRRRAQQRSVKAFSDAGGMLRLNLDQMTPQTNPARLLPPH